MTGPCLLFFAAYYLFFLIVAQIMPPGQSIFRAPLGGWSVLITYSYLTIIYAGIREFRHGGVRLNEKRFWTDYLLLLLVASVYLTFFNSFGYAKSMVGWFNPFYLDPWLQKWDIALSGGTVPLRWFIEAMTPDRVIAFSTIYFGAWGFVMLLYVLWQLALPRGTGRTHFLSSFLMVWIIGGVICATLLSSTGPIFYDTFYHDQYSAMNGQLIAKLYAGRADTNAIYHLLLDLATNDIPVEWNGISAMPSMHTAVVMLLVLHSARYARRLLWVTLPLAICIIAGSVILGWHYLLDTYGSALIVYGIWRLNAYILKRRKPASAV